MNKNTKPLTESKDLQSKIITPFIGETIETLESMAGLTASAGEPFSDSVEDFRFKGYAVAAETSGNINGYILMHLYIETTLSIGNKVLENLLGLEEECEEMNDDITDAVAE
jgi:two-component system, response regulator PdtaR